MCNVCARKAMLSSPAVKPFWLTIRLTVRWDELNADTQALYPQENLRQPLRIVIDSQNRVTPEHRIVQQPGETWFARPEDERQWPEGVRSLWCRSTTGISIWWC
jgi:riboflavin biosynthesis pyrimidine reductase